MSPPATFSLSSTFIELYEQFSCIVFQLLAGWFAQKNVVDMNNSPDFHPTGSGLLFMSTTFFWAFYDEFIVWKL